MAIWSTLAYVSFGCLIAIASFLTFSIFILKSYNDSKYEISCSSEETKDKLNNGRNLTIGGIAVSSIFIILFLILGIISIVLSLKGKSDISGKLKEGFGQIGTGISTFFDPEIPRSRNYRQ